MAMTADRRKRILNKNGEQFAEKLSLFDPQIDICSDYRGATTKMQFYCHRCGEKFWRLPTTMFRDSTNCACTVCNKRRGARKHEVALNELIRRLHSRFPRIQYLDGYQGTDKRCHFKCDRCGHDFWKKFYNFDHSTYGCPFCFKEHQGEWRRLDPDEFAHRVYKSCDFVKLLTSYVNDGTKRALWFKKMYEKELKAKKKQKGFEDH